MEGRDIIPFHQNSWCSELDIERHSLVFVASKQLDYNI
jgi:hypothetical protein